MTPLVPLMPLSPIGIGLIGALSNPIPSEPFYMTITSPVEPVFTTVIGGTITSTDNGDGTWTSKSYSPLAQLLLRNEANITEVVVIKTDGLRIPSTLFDNCDSLIKAEFRDSCDWSQVTTMASFASNCAEFTTLIFPSNFDTSSVTNLTSFLSKSKKMKNIDVSMFITDKVISFYRMFWTVGHGITELDVSNFSFASAISTGLRDFCSANYELTSVKLPASMNTDKPACDMGNMFNGDAKLVCISNLDTTNATSTTNIFAGCGLMTAPNATEQTALESGSSYVNASPCL